MEEQGSNQGGETREVAKDVTKKTIEKGEEAIQTGKTYAAAVSEKGQGLATEAKDKAVSLGETTKDKAKDVGRTIRDTASDLAHDKETQTHLAETAGTFLGAMRSQGGGIGQETEAFGRGVQMVGDTVEKTVEHIPEEAKESLIRGGKKLAETTDKLWTRVFSILEKGLDVLERRLFEEEGEGSGERRDVEEGRPTEERISQDVGPRVPLLGFGRRRRSAAEEEEERRQRERRQGIVSIVTRVVGGIILLLLLTVLLFFLGFFLLPILLIALLVMLISFQCWAWCGVGAT